MIVEMHIVLCRYITTYTVDTNEEGLRISGLWWGIRKSTQEVDAGCTPGCVSHCIAAILHSRVIVIPAEDQTGCVGLQNNQCDPAASFTTV